MKIEKEVRQCDRCLALYPVWWDSSKDDGPDYQVTYLGKRYDLCANCYDKFTEWLKGQRMVICK